MREVFGFSHLKFFFLALAVGGLFGEVGDLLLEMGDALLEAAFFLGEALDVLEKGFMRRPNPAQFLPKSGAFVLSELKAKDFYFLFQRLESLGEVGFLLGDLGNLAAIVGDLAGDVLGEEVLVSFFEGVILFYPLSLLR
jgi:hypothetical protein